MAPNTPKRFSNIRREQRVSGNAHTARWARNHHPHKSPKHGSQFYRVTITDRVVLNNITTTGNAMKQSAQKVVPGPATPNTDSRPAEPGRRIRAGGRGGGNIRKDEQPAQAVRGIWRAAREGRAAAWNSLTSPSSVHNLIPRPAPCRRAARGSASKTRQRASRGPRGPSGQKEAGASPVAATTPATKAARVAAAAAPASAALQTSEPAESSA